MTRGTRSVLFGYHCLLIHGWFVLWGWLRLYGVKKQQIGIRHIGGVYTRPVYAHLLHPALWIALFWHDIGYWRKPNMDGAEGERHPEACADFLHEHYGHAWGNFALYHSRFYAKQYGVAPSLLCYADKVAFTLYPTWLIVLLVTLSGEVAEYKANYAHSNPDAAPFTSTTDWARNVKMSVNLWVGRWRAGEPDTITQARKHS